MSETRDERSGAQLAHKILNTYGGEVDDFFKLWPADKRYFFSSDKKAFIAYGAKYGVAVCMGAPAGSDKSIGLVLAEFKDYCAKQHLKMVFVQTTSRHKDEFLFNGLRSILIGADAVVDLKRFNETTVRSKNFRNIVNRFDKLGYTFEKSSPPHNVALIDELRIVSDSWLTLAHRKEWSFLTGRYDIDYLQQVKLDILRDQDGHVKAFFNELPNFRHGTATIDLMRHSADALPNSVDYLFTRLMADKQSEGYKSFSLGISPIDGRPFAVSRADKVLARFYGMTNSFIGFRGLHRFKAKYDPDWEPSYVWYQGHPRNLFHIGFSILSLLRTKD
jgi:phosphatidylglycerol lysyltransferase